MAHAFAFVRPLALGSAALVALAGTRAGAVVLVANPIALTGTDGALGPGMGPGVFFGNGGLSTLGSASAAINNSGQVIFRAADNAATANNGLWLYSAGVNANIALNGQSVSGFAYANSGFNGPIINSAGHTAWRYSTTALVGNNTGAPALAARTTTAAPGTGGGTFSSFTFPAPLMNGAGNVAFVASMPANAAATPPIVISGVNANSAGIWAGSPGAVGLAVRQNDVYPDVGVTDVRLGTFGSSLAFNPTGQIFLAANLQGTVVSTTGSANNAALLRYTPGSPSMLEVIARRGDPAPGSAGEFYNGITASTTLNMNAAGKVVFNSSLRNAATGGTQTAASALFTNTSGPLTMVARAGNAMPAIAGANGAEFSGVNWGTNFSNNLINSGGTVLFQNSGMTGAGITSTNSTGLFKMDSSGTFSKVMRQADVAPAVSQTAGDVVTFNGLQGNPCFNAAGQVVFLSTLASTLGGVSGLIGNNLGLFAVDVDGSILMIAQRQTLFHVGPGDDRTVSAIGGIGSGGGEDGRATSLNDNGDLVFSLDFADGSSGVFVTHIPSPGSAALLALGGLVALRRRRAGNL